MKCPKDKAPCLHAPCTESQGIKCCCECPEIMHCTTACFKVGRPKCAVDCPAFERWVERGD